MNKYLVCKEGDILETPSFGIRWGFIHNDIKWIGYEYGEDEVVPTISGWILCEGPEGFAEVFNLIKN